MNYKSEESKKFFVCLFLVMVIFLGGLVLPYRASGYSNENYRDYFSIKVINFCMPVMESASSEQCNENEKSMKDVFLEMIGFDTRDPLTVLKKEVSYFKSNPNEYTEVDMKKASGEEKSSDMVSVNPFESFELDEKDVAKVEGDNQDDNTMVSIYNPDIVKKIDPSKVQVLIYHSHTSEGYKPGEKLTLDNKYNVTSVGDELEKELKNYGINVIHDKTVHDANYRDSYKKSGDTLDKYLQKYGDFDLVIDMHRDSVDNKKLITTKLNGENVARFMFVMAVKNPHYEKNKTVIDKLLKISNKHFPGLARGNGIFTYDVGMNYFNQTKSNNAFLIEVGAHTSHIDEVKNTAKYLGRIIAEYLNGKSE